MRLVVLTVLALGLFSLGATCLPIIDETAQGIDSGTTFAVVISTPETDATIPGGSQFDIHWRVVTKSAATASLYVESRVDLTRTYLVDNLTVTGTESFTSPWDTTDFAGGEYVIYASLSSSADSASATAAGRITVDTPPEFTFTSPTEDVEFVAADGLTVKFESGDAFGTGARYTAGLDLDSTHDSGNEIFIGEDEIPEETTADEVTWDGTDLSGNTVEPGVYNLFVFIEDDVNSEFTVESGIKITVPEEDDENPVDEDPLELGIVRICPSPIDDECTGEDDLDFLDADDSVVIEYSVNEFDDVLIDLGIDTDDGHSNGNERNILVQLTVTGGTEKDTFDWDGTYSDGTDVPDGIYRVYIVMDTGSGTPGTADADTLVFRRTTADKPLIGMLEPTSMQTLAAGARLRIRWRDDDPEETATIRLAIDDDPNPAEAVETDEPEMEIDIGDRQASLDGDLQDSYSWQIPGTLDPGRYYIFGYIVVDGTDEHWSVAPGSFVIDDPLGG